MDYSTYSPLPGCYDETFAATGEPHVSCSMFSKHLQGLSDEELVKRQHAAELLLQNLGITFTVYGHDEGTEKIWPFDLLPRIVDGAHWEQIEKGLKQRVQALNLFIDDLYNDQKIISDGVVPADLVLGSKTYRKQMVGFHPPQNAWCHISGVDLVRGGDGQFYVLEDNLRCPSGVSYVLENREVLKRTLGSLFQGMDVIPVDDYPEQLLTTLLSCAPEGVESPTAVLLTPGIYNSALFRAYVFSSEDGDRVGSGVGLGNS